MSYQTVRRNLLPKKNVMITASILLLFSVGMVVRTAAMDTSPTIPARPLAETANSTNVMKAYKPEAKLQIGYYDLLSPKKEVYDINLVFTPEGIVSSVVNPNDIRFMSKGKLERNTRAGRVDTYHYSTIFYQNPDENSMFDGEVDYLTRNDIWVKSLVVKGQPLVIAQNGMILLNNLPDGKPSVKPKDEH